jgi:hypothetical protein
MTFPTKEVLAALVTIAVALLGYSQWKRTKRSGRFIEDREIAYKSVWQSLEDVHLYARQGTFSEATFDDLLRKARTLLIQNSLHIADEDKGAAERYLTALRQFGRMVGQLEAENPARHEIEATGEGFALADGDASSYLAYQQAREAVVERFRRALGAGEI